jgi:hypothetical protein
MTAVSVAQKRMAMPEIREKARTLGIRPGKMKKAELIHAIQTAEGFTPCYGRSTGACPWTECCWRGDCFKASA